MAKPRPTSGQDEPIGIGELLDDMTDTVGFEELDQKAQQSLVKQQKAVYAELKSIVKASKGKDEILLPRPLELAIADIYSKKEDLVRRKRATQRDRVLSAETHAKTVAKLPLTPEQQEKLQAVIDEIDRKTRETVQYIGELDMRRASKQRVIEVEEMDQIRRSLKDDGTRFDMGA
jgi:hypothetical protein